MPGFHALSAAWLFALIAPLVLLYFLKLRRPRAEISSLILWRRVLHDDRVNAPFQRFKRSLLFWLQLALLVLLAFAAMQPFLRGEAETAARVPLLIDCSASMAALDRPGGDTRLDAAKRRAIELIDNLSSGQAACVIGFSGRARQLTGFTCDRRRLLDAVRSLSVEHETGRVEGALRLAEAIAKTSAFDRVHLITDGNLPATVDFALPFELAIESLPPPGRNVGITAMSARRRAAGAWELFVDMGATAGYAGTVALQLRVGEQRIGDRSVSFRGESSKSVVFRVDAEDTVVVRASLVPDGFDALGIDDRAWVTLPKPRSLRVAVGSGLSAFSAALEGTEGIELVAAAAGPDVMIAAEHVATRAAVALFVDALPPELDPVFTKADREVAVVDWDRASPVLAHVDLSEIVVFSKWGWRTDRGVTDLETRGYRVYVHGDRVPLMIGRTDRDVARYHLLFEPGRSTLPYRLGFPVLVTNLLRVARERAGLLDASGGRTGVLPDTLALGGARLERGREYRVDGPGGASWRRRANADGRLSGIPAPRVGAYVVRDGGDDVTTVHCALLSANETRLGRVERLRFDERLTVEAIAPTPAERPLWPWLAAIAFGVLLVEWWFYQRRAGAPA